jgi:hypothetical protein
MSINLSMNKECDYSTALCAQSSSLLLWIVLLLVNHMMTNSQSLIFLEQAFTILLVLHSLNVLEDARQMKDQHATSSNSVKC